MLRSNLQLLIPAFLAFAHRTKVRHATLVFPFGSGVLTKHRVQFVAGRHYTWAGLAFRLDFSLPVVYFVIGFFKCFFGRFSVALSEERAGALR